MVPPLPGYVNGPPPSCFAYGCLFSLPLLAPRFDPDSLCIVAQDGLTTRLLVVDYSTLGIIEQVGSGDIECPLL